MRLLQNHPEIILLPALGIVCLFLHAFIDWLDHSDRPPRRSNNWPEDL